MTLYCKRCKGIIAHDTWMCSGCYNDLRSAALTLAQLVKYIKCNPEYDLRLKAIDAAEKQADLVINLAGGKIGIP